MKRVLLSLLLLFGSIVIFAQGSRVSFCDLRDGDLLFVVNNRGNAITAVTNGTDNLPIDHVGVFVVDSLGWLSVIEAGYDGVVQTKLMRFCLDSRVDSVSQPVIVVGRVQGFDVDASFTNLRRCLGKPYDFYYSDTDDAIYCSELVQKCFVDTSGQQVFTTIPMTFRDYNGKIPSYWKRLYGKRGMKVPEGEPGSNPGDLSRRDNVLFLGFLEVH